MNKVPDAYDSHDADYFLREAVSNLKGKIDFLYYGGLDEEGEDAALEFYEKLKISTDTLYGMLTSNIVEKANRINHLHGLVVSDLELARKIQESILPGAVAIDGLALCARYIPMAVVGGDIYDITELRPGYARIFLADATGHGVQAALITMIIKSVYEMVKSRAATPAALLDEMNGIFTRVYRSLGTFFTCIVVDIDLQGRTLSYASAGHPVQYLAGDDGAFTALEHTGKLIGLTGDHPYRMISHPLPRAGKLLLFTDGLYEEYNASMEEYGEKRLRALLEENRGLGIEKIVGRALDGVMGFIGGQDLHDDITIICAGW
ncbi:MAG TPA: PP2C family protein-serine/threonine phosphatase [Spirochaetota bacterium]|nr:PP2C family protein-serine/threonine phosphatase [Spirochaetota bacterium]HPV40373.1 PP2C family protein-serine/threonine phosphatase [Spirochaetota bacterium]